MATQPQSVYAPKAVAKPLSYSHDSSQVQHAQTGTPTTAPGLQAAAPEMDAGQAAAAGLGWVDKNHPLYGTAGYVGYTPPAAQAGGSTPGAAAGQPAATGTPNSIPGAAAAGSTYSATPGAAPTQNTTNQAAQDVVRNSYLERATQPAKVDPNDPNIRQPADAFAAAEERARRDQVADLAEGLAGTGATGAQTAETRLINERSAGRRAGFEADLVRQELSTKRAEIENALKMTAGMIDADQTRGLQKMLADIDAQLKTQALQSSSGLGAQELALKDKLGMMGGNLDLMQMLMQNDQFGKTMGFNMADREAYWNQQNLQNLFG